MTDLDKRCASGNLPTPPSITCPICGSVSFNPGDIANRYCGRCHLFLDDIPTDHDGLPTQEDVDALKAAIDACQRAARSTSGSSL